MPFRNAYSLMTETILLRIIAKLVYLYLSFPTLNILIPKEIVERYNMTLWKHNEKKNVYMYGNNVFCKPIPDFCLPDLNILFVWLIWWSSLQLLTEHVTITYLWYIALNQNNAYYWVGGISVWAYRMQHQHVSCLNSFIGNSFLYKAFFFSLNS